MPSPAPQPPHPPDAPPPTRLLKAGKGLLGPDVWVVAADSPQPRVWKTWGRKPSWARATLGRWLATREGTILRMLEGNEGFPRFVGHPHPWTLDMTLLDAEAVPEVKRGGHLAPEYFDRLWSMIARMHALGITHGDLRRKNLLRAPGSATTPRMVDFTQSLLVALPPRGVTGWIFHAVCRVDRVTFLKLKRWYLEKDQLSPEERAEAEDVPWHLRAGRALRKGIYRPWKHFWHGRGRA